MGSLALSLIAHPSTPVPGITEVSAQVERDDGALWLRFFVEGGAEAVDLGGMEEPVRTDGLWRATCIEAFVTTEEASGGYLELNFAPGGAWAAYTFDRYRAGMREQPLSKQPEVFLDLGETWFSIESRVELPVAWAVHPWTVALAAVLKAPDGSLSYWALRHPPGAPDFHHADNFALILGAPGDQL